MFCCRVYVSCSHKHFPCQNLRKFRAKMKRQHQGAQSGTTEDEVTQGEGLCRRSLALTCEISAAGGGRDRSTPL